MDTQSQINSLQNQISLISLSSGVTHDTQTSLTERLSINNFYFTVSNSLAGGLSQTGGNYGVFFVAPFPCMIVSIMENHYIAGTDSGSVTLQIDKLADTQTFGTGTVLSTAFNLKSTAKTTVNGLLDPTKILLDTGDRLSFDVTGTLTSLEGISVTVLLQKI